MFYDCIVFVNEQRFIDENFHGDLFLVDVLSVDNTCENLEDISEQNGVRMQNSHEQFQQCSHYIPISVPVCFVCPVPVFFQDFDKSPAIAP
jgi:hypothetical protein